MDDAALSVVLSVCTIVFWTVCDTLSKPKARAIVASPPSPVNIVCGHVLPLPDDPGWKNKSHIEDRYLVLGDLEIYTENDWLRIAGVRVHGESATEYASAVRRAWVRQRLAETESKQLCQCERKQKDDSEDP